MNTVCPQCGGNIKEQFGMMQCPSCSAFLFIDMEGNAFMGNAPQAQDEALQEVVSNEPAQGFDHLPPTEEPAQENQYNTPVADADFKEFSFDAVHESAPESVPESGPGTTHDSQNETSQPGPDFGPADDPLGLSGFANSDASMALNGPLVVRVIISGVDTKELRESIREALEDSRFQWNPTEVMAKLSKGKLTIEGMSPVKAMILINQIKRLQLKISWEQNAITQMENP